MTRKKLRIGDLVACWPDKALESIDGIIVGFNEKGDGGQDFVHVLCNGEVRTFMSFDIEVLAR